MNVENEHKRSPLKTFTGIYGYKNVVFSSHVGHAALQNTNKYACQQSGYKTSMDVYITHG